ncbi:MAG: hypothetical protein OEY34_09545, partial [Cyclobacteriaceae bacterium]|nr:hypothetical protein [Cyclobacteriaceae bacterium]
MRKYIIALLLYPTWVFSQELPQEIKAPKILEISLGVVGELNYLKHNLVVFDKKFQTPGFGFSVNNKLTISKKWYLDATINVIKTSRNSRYTDIFRWNSDSTMLFILDERYHNYWSEVDFIERTDISLNEDFSVFNFQLRPGFMVLKNLSVELGLSYKYWYPTKEHPMQSVQYPLYSGLYHQELIATSGSIAYHLKSATVKMIYNRDITPIFGGYYIIGT